VEQIRKGGKNLSISKAGEESKRERVRPISRETAACFTSERKRKKEKKNSGLSSHRPFAGEEGTRKADG